MKKSFLPRSAHYVANRLVGFNLARCQANFTSPGDTFSIGNIGRHCSTFTGQKSSAHFLVCERYLMQVWSNITALLITSTPLFAGLT